MVFWLTLLGSISASVGQILSIDVGSQYFKAAMVRPGKFDIVENMRSKRKSPLAISFMEDVRQFGDDALLHQGKNGKKVPMFFKYILGANMTAPGSVPGLSESFYPMLLDTHPERMCMVFDGLIPEENRVEEGDSEIAHGPMTTEEVMANVLAHIRQLAEMGAAADSGKKTKTSFKEAVLTIPYWFTMRQREALLDAAQIAGYEKVQLVHEVTAAAVQRAIDVSFNVTDPKELEKEDKSLTVLFFNMGAFHTEACVARYMPVKESKSKVAPYVHVVHCAHSLEAGGHHIDIALAEAMLERFCEKHPKLCKGETDIRTNSRAKSKLLRKAQDVKQMLSANKESLFSVEGLFEEQDFRTSVTRAQLEELMTPTLKEVEKVVNEALEGANVTVNQVNETEVIGGSWRVPKIQESLLNLLSPSPHFSQLGQHLNGEEAFALGAGFVAANNSMAFRVRKVMVADSSAHSYSIDLRPLEAENLEEDFKNWNKTMTLIPSGHRFGAKKSVKVSANFDLQLGLIEDEGGVLDLYKVTGLTEAAQEKYKDFAPPSVLFRFEFDFSGIMRLHGAEAVFEEEVEREVNVTVPVNVTAPAEEKEEKEEEKEGVNSTASNSSSPSPPLTETRLEKRVEKVKRKVVLNVERFPSLPRPMDESEKETARDRLYNMEKYDELVRLTEASKNEFEAYIYSSRDLLENEGNCQKVSLPSLRSSLLSSLSQEEEWLYEDGFDAKLEEYRKRHDELKSQIEPIISKAKELELRESLPSYVSDGNATIWKNINYIQKNMTWVDKEKVENLRNATLNFTEWWEEVEGKQKELELTEEPAYKVSTVKTKLSKLIKLSKQLMKIKYVPPVDSKKSKKDKKEDFKKKFKGFEKFNFSDPDAFNSKEWQDLMAGMKDFNTTDFMNNFNATDFKKEEEKGEGEVKEEEKEEGEVKEEEKEEEGEVKEEEVVKEDADVSEEESKEEEEKEEL